MPSPLAIKRFSQNDIPRASQIHPLSVIARDGDSGGGGSSSKFNMMRHNSSQENPCEQNGTFNGNKFNVRY